MYHDFVTHSSTDGCLGCFQILAIVNNTAVNTGVHTLFQIIVLGFFPDIFPAVESLGHKAVPFLIFWVSSILFSIVTTSICIPTKSAWGFPFLYILTNILWFIDDNHSDRCEMVSHCGFNLHFSDDWWCWASFHMSNGHLYVLFGEVFIQVLCPFLNWIVCFLLLSCISSLQILDVSPLSDVSLAYMVNT